MKRTLIGAVFLLIMSVTNPNKAEYVYWALDRMEKKSEQANVEAVEDVGPEFINHHTEVENYVFFSIYTTTSYGHKTITIGIVNHFIPIIHE